MKVKFLATAKGRDWKVGDVRDFKGASEESYARKYIDRGWAEEVGVDTRRAAPAVPPVTGDQQSGSAAGGNQQQGATAQK